MGAHTDDLALLLQMCQLHQSCRDQDASLCIKLTLRCLAQHHAGVHTGILAGARKGGQTLIDLFPLFLGVNVKTSVQTAIDDHAVAQLLTKLCRQDHSSLFINVVIEFAYQHRMSPTFHRFLELFTPIINFFVSFV